MKNIREEVGTTAYIVGKIVKSWMNECVYEDLHGKK